MDKRKLILRCCSGLSGRGADFVFDLIETLQGLGIINIYNFCARMLIKACEDAPFSFTKVQLFFMTKVGNKANSKQFALLWYIRHEALRIVRRIVTRFAKRYHYIKMA